MTPHQQGIIDLLDARPGEKPGRWVARCPCSENHKNQDRRPSLSILLGDDGWLHANCHAGCHRDAVRAALGRHFTEWGPGVHGGHPSQKPVAARPVAWYGYRDLRGRLRYEIVRYEPKNFRRRRPHPTQSKEWVWALGAGEYARINGEWLLAAKCKNIPANAVIEELKAEPLIPYMLPRWSLCDPKIPIIIPEGEKAVETLFSLGFRGTTMPGGSLLCDYQRMGRYLAGRRVIIWPDNDMAGSKRVSEMLPALIQNQVSEIRVINPPKDRERGWDVTDLAIELSDAEGWPTNNKQAIERIRSAVIDLVKVAPAYKLTTMVKV
jgi:putative DNA primase/helicase